MKRKIMAVLLSSALVFCMIPAAASDVFAETVIDEIEFTIEVPECNTYITGLDDTSQGNLQTPQPKVTLPAGVPYVLGNDPGDNYANWRYMHSSGSLQRFGDDYMVGGTTYYAVIFFRVYGDYSFADKENLKINVHGGEPYEVYYVGHFTDSSKPYWSATVYVSVYVPHDPADEWTVKPGSYVDPTWDAPGTHIEERLCRKCGNAAESKTVTDGTMELYRVTLDTSAGSDATLTDSEDAARSYIHMKEDEPNVLYIEKDNWDAAGLTLNDLTKYISVEAPQGYEKAVKDGYGPWVLCDPSAIKDENDLYDAAKSLENTTLSDEADADNELTLYAVYFQIRDTSPDTGFTGHWELVLLDVLFMVMAACFICARYRNNAGLLH